MHHNPEGIGEFAALVGQEVVVDARASFLYIGTLESVGEDAVVLTDADVHSSEDSLTTREVYLLETRKNGIRPNRTRVYVMRREIVSISRLDDVMLY